MSDSSFTIHIPSGSVFLLKGEVQPYAWGGNSFISQLLGIENPDDSPQAELWMGAHQKAPSEVKLDDHWVQLDKVIEHNAKHLLGPDVAERFDGRLPFLFKVLDVKDMLSIQVHPSKSEAEKGFERENQEGIPLSAKHRNYRDDNHKPEIMVALTGFWLLHGFRKETEIERMLDEVPEFSVLKSFWQSAGYRGLYQYIMEIPQKEVNQILSPLADRLIPEYHKGTLGKENPDFWAARAIENSVLPEGDLDRGIFSIYFFNLVHLNEGEGIYQDAGIPHAYLEGVNVELMANSDNVLRGGLTPKHIDVPELLKHVVFEAVEPNILKGKQISETEKVYKSPAPDFELSQISVSDNTHQQGELHSAEILIILEGQAKLSFEGGELELSKGEICFAPAHVPYQITSSENTKLYKATVPE